MTKRNTGGDMKASKVGEPKLKGLERRTHKGRRAEPRRKSDPATDVELTETSSEQMSLASEADALVAHYYEELFNLFPDSLSAFWKQDADDQHRELAVALELVVDVLHKQGERVKVLEKLELKHRNDVAQSDQNSAIAETLRDLMADFSSNAWTGAIDVLRGARETQD